MGVELHFTHAQRTHHGTATAQARQGLRQPPGGRGLAIGSRDGHHIQMMAWVLIVGRGNEAAGLLQVRIGRHGCGPSFGHASQPLCFQQAGRSTLRQHLGRMQSAIVPRPRPSQESVTPLHLPAVGAQTSRTALA